VRAHSAAEETCVVADPITRHRSSPQRQRCGAFVPVSSALYGFHNPLGRQAALRPSGGRRPAYRVRPRLVLRPHLLRASVRSHEVSHRVVALDLRGCGRSDQPEDGYDIPTLADDVAGPRGSSARCRSCAYWENVSLKAFEPGCRRFRSCLRRRASTPSRAPGSRDPEIPHRRGLPDTRRWGWCRTGIRPMSQGFS
jgi:hypothetical protein